MRRRHSRRCLPSNSLVYSLSGATVLERLRRVHPRKLRLTFSLPLEFIRLIIEELETSQNVYTVAAAARSTARAEREVPAESARAAPSPRSNACDARTTLSCSIGSTRLHRAGKTRSKAVSREIIARTLALLGPAAKPALTVGFRGAHLSRGRGALFLLSAPRLPDTLTFAEVAPLFWSRLLLFAPRRRDARAERRRSCPSDLSDLALKN